MTLVVDANVAVKWLVQQQGADDVRRVQAYRGPLVAPAMLIAETANGLWRHVANGDVSATNAQAAVAGLAWWFHELVEDHSLAGPALTLAIELNYSLYNCLYPALARTRSAPLVTADKKFINRLSATQYSSNVVHLADWK
jgi:predicted nucleic acid-binding protein